MSWGSLKGDTSSVDYGTCKLSSCCNGDIPVLKTEYIRLYSPFPSSFV